MDGEGSATMSRKVMGALSSYKVTMVCGFITILVLRGAVAGGSGGLGVSDFEVVDKERLVDAEHAWVGSGVARKLAQIGDAEDAKNSEEVTSSKLAEEELWDRRQPYSLGPKISKWDEQRAVWNEKNPGKNKSRSGKPKMLLVSGSQPGPCVSPMGDFYHLKFLKNRVDYARLHDLKIFYNMATIKDEMNSFWSKLPLLRKLMLSHPEVEWIWWMDSDAVITDMVFEMPLDKYEDKNLVVYGVHDTLFEQHRWMGLNTGSFLIRNCQWSLDLLDAWAPFGPKGENRVNAGKLLTAKLVDRPVFEADDQSALAYLLLFDDPKWKSQTHLELEYFLHGNWKHIVYYYENLMARSRPGSGDGRWPFVTHFVGCNSCQRYATEEVEECFAQMERAFNFADNQVLDKYGYAHRNLGSYRTQRIRQDTSDPLGLGNEMPEEHKPVDDASETQP